MNLQNKNKADKTLHALGFNTSQRERIISLAKDNIANNASNVNNNETKFSLDVDRFSNDLRNAQLWQYDDYEHFSKAKKLYQQKSDIFLCHAK